jgi:hypothetical protein
VTRYLHLTAGQDPEQAIRSVEDRGFRVLGAELYAGDSLPVLGICEVAATVVKENRQGGQKGDRERGVEVTGGACGATEFSRPGVKP